MDPIHLDAKFGRQYPAGTLLFEQGDHGQHMYIIQSGKVEISRKVGDREAVVAVLPAGEFFGEMSIINNAPRSASAKVIEEARLVVIDANTLETMIRESKEIAVRLLQKLCARLAEAQRQIELLVLRDPNSRVVHCLRQEAEALGEPASAGIAVPADEHTIAGRLGLEVSEVVGVLQKLERARLVSRDDGKLVISEVGKLQDFLDFLEMKERYGEPSSGPPRLIIVDDAE